MSRKLTDIEIAAFLERCGTIESGTRQRLLAAARLLCDFTDENEGLTSQEIARVLSRLSGSNVAENSVRADLDALASCSPFGAEVIKPGRGEKTGYRCAAKPFSSHDSSLLMGMVRTSKFVNEEQRARLCAKLEEIMSDRELEEMVESIFVDERETHEGMNALAAMVAASSAIRNNEQLCFRYRRHLMNGDELIDRQISSEDPVCLVYSFGHYYLETCVTTDKVPEGEPFFRRLDHMTNAMVSGKKLRNPGRVDELRRRVAADVRERIDMYGDGTSRTLFLKVEGRCAQYAYDRFGHDLVFSHVSEDDAGNPHGYACVRTQLSPTLYRWLFGMGGGVFLAKPKGLTWARTFRGLSSCSADTLRQFVEDYEAAHEGYISMLESALGAERDAIAKGHETAWI